jgi:hypothetical protein
VFPNKVFNNATSLPLKNKERREEVTEASERECEVKCEREDQKMHRGGRVVLSLKLKEEEDLIWRTIG